MLQYAIRPCPFLSAPYSLEVFDQIREAMLHRSEVLGEAAESAGAVVSEESASILRVKAKDHVEKVEVRKKT